VSLHLPLNEDTRGLISVNELDLMKEGAIIINTARAGLIDEEAAALALRSGKLSGVGLDVGTSRNVDGYMKVESPLFEFENVVYTPHSGGSTREAIARSHKQWVENVCRVLKGEKPHFIVNNI
jgi:phosphoglycerate dehydrogenase-like enzyme